MAINDDTADFDLDADFELGFKQVKLKTGTTGAMGFFFNLYGDINTITSRYFSFRTI